MFLVLFSMNVDFTVLTGYQSQERGGGGGGEGGAALRSEREKDLPGLCSSGPAAGPCPPSSRIYKME